MCVLAGTMPAGSAGRRRDERGMSAAAGSVHTVHSVGEPMDDFERGRGVDEREPAGGDSGVAAALARLEELRELDVAEHVEVLSDVHRRLHEALAALDGN